MAKVILTTQSTTLNKTQYSYKSRFEEGVGTNPEELIAAAHAGCFTMALAFGLQRAGNHARYAGDDGHDHTRCQRRSADDHRSQLVLKAKIPGITNEKFQEFAKGAEQGCPDQPSAQSRDQPGRYAGTKT